MNIVKNIFIIFLVSMAFILPNTIFAQQESVPDPIIVLQIEPSQAAPGDEIKFIIFYGNDAETEIKEAEIILDLFADGDTDLEYVSSSDNVEWISGRDKRKASWKINTIEQSEDVADLAFVSF